MEYIALGLVIVLGTIAIWWFNGPGDPAYPKCDCGHRLVEIRNGCKTIYDYPEAEPWNVKCPKCGRKHFIIEDGSTGGC